MDQVDLRSIVHPAISRQRKKMLAQGPVFSGFNGPQYLFLLYPSMTQCTINIIIIQGGFTKKNTITVKFE